MPRSGWFGWIQEHAQVVGAVTVWVVIAGVGIGALVAYASSQDHNPSSPATVGPPSGGGGGLAVGGKGGGKLGKTGKVKGGKKGGGKGGGKGLKSGGTGTVGAGGGTTGGGSGGSGGGGSGGGGGKRRSGGGSGGQTQPTGQAVGASCQPTQPTVNGQPETGISATAIKIGIMITESDQLPQQFRPLYEGLSAFANRVNGSGGICHRRLEIVKADDTPPASSGQLYEQLAQQVFAFVGSSSLFETQWYQTTPPFNPITKDGNTDEYVPDIGGLALGFSNGNYTRAQSTMYAGVVGSLSPTMVGGGQFRQWTHSSPGNKCRRAGVVYLNEPTGASENQASLGAAALSAKWGGGIPASRYEMPLLAPEPAYETLVINMIRDGVNCVFTYADRQSNVNLVKAEASQGVWPPSACSTVRKASNQCFWVTYMPFTAADEKFVKDAGGAGQDVRTFIPHLPLSEGSGPVRQFLGDLNRCNQAHFAGCDGNAEPSTFSVLGYASGAMFADAVSHCGSAPTRTCVMAYLKRLQGYTAGGLMGPITPFQCSKVNYNKYTWCYKAIFTNSVALQEKGPPSQGLNAFRRSGGSGFFHDTLHVVRGSPA